MASDEQTMKSLVGRLYQMLADGDNDVPPDPDNFIAWCNPGIPYQPDDLEFATKGLEAGTGPEARRLLAQASDFARLMNFIPDPSGTFNGEQQQTIFKSGGSFIWNVYDNTLKFSEVASGSLTPEQQANLEKFEKLLRPTKIDIFGNEKVDETGGPLKAAYLKGLKDYLDAAKAYNDVRISALNSDSPQAVQDWALNASNYRLSVQAAMGLWVAQGYKNDYEQMLAYIDQITQRDLTLWKRGLQDTLAKGLQTDLVSGQNFYFTSVVPGDFANQPNGWTVFDFSESNVATYDRSETNSWSVGGGGAWGLWGGGVSANGSSTETKSSIDTSNFKIKFEYTQVPILRPWFAPEFLTNTAWRFPSSLGLSPLSDGNKPPTGQLVAYPTTAIFARNLLIDFKELHEATSTYASEINSGASVRYGPFRLSGGYSRSVGERKFENKIKNEGLSVSGMQLIALKCSTLPKTPNPSGSITSWS